MACLLLAVSDQLLVGPGREGGGQTPNPPQRIPTMTGPLLVAAGRPAGRGSGVLRKLRVLVISERFRFVFTNERLANTEEDIPLYLGPLEYVAAVHNWQNLVPL